MMSKIKSSFIIKLLNSQRLFSLLIIIIMGEIRLFCMIRRYKRRFMFYRGWRIGLLYRKRGVNFWLIILNLYGKIRWKGRKANNKLLNHLSIRVIHTIYKQILTFYSETSIFRQHSKWSKNKSKKIQQHSAQNMLSIITKYGW